MNDTAAGTAQQPLQQQAGIPLSFDFVIFAALAIVFTVAFVRALRWPVAWRSRKPLACNACMTGWAVIFAGLALHGIGSAVPFILLHLLPAGGLAFVTLEWLRGISGGEPPALPGDPTV